MYWRHFNLTAEPFSLTPDPSFLYLSPVHAEAFAAMTMGLRERRGFVTMIGEVGTGKTTLVYSLLNGLEPEIHTAYVSNARLSFDGILRLALRDFGAPCESTRDSDLLDAFNAFLLDCANQGATAALVIDEAQNLSYEAFEDLRLLSNFETYSQKLLQIVLVGQPELDAKLRDPALRQVVERVAVRCVVNPLTRAQARHYLEHRLAAVNGSLDIFTRAALRLLIASSRGIPRSLNILAHNAMLFAYGEGKDRVTSRFVRAAIHEKEGRSLIRLWKRPRSRTTVIGASRSSGIRSFWPLTATALAGLVLGLFLGGTDWISRARVDLRASEAVTLRPSTTDAVPLTPAQDAEVRTATTGHAEPGSGDFDATALSAIPSGAQEPAASPDKEVGPATVSAEPGDADMVVDELRESSPVIDADDAQGEARQRPEQEALVAQGSAEKPTVAMAEEAESSPSQSVDIETAPATVAAPATASAAVANVQGRAPPAPAAAARASTRVRQPVPVAAPKPAARDAREPLAAVPATTPAVRVAVAETPTTLQGQQNSSPPDNNDRQARGTVVTVPAGSSLSDLMLAVYGQYNSQMIQGIQAVNPQVTNPDRIVAGDALRFPEQER